MCRGLVASQRDCVAHDGHDWPGRQLSAGIGQHMAAIVQLPLVRDGNVQYLELVDRWGACPVVGLGPAEPSPRAGPVGIGGEASHGTRSFQLS